MEVGMDNRKLHSISVIPRNRYANNKFSFVLYWFGLSKDMNTFGLDSQLRIMWATSQYGQYCYVYLEEVKLLR